MGNYLGATLKLSGSQIGSAYSVFSIAALVSPFFVGMVADRFFATERIMAVLHLAGGALAWMVSWQQSFQPLFWLLLGFQLCYMPTFALVNSLSFHNLPDARDFPKIMRWGSFGIIVAGVLIGYVLKAEDSNVQFKIASLASFAMAAYCLTLPHTPPKSSGTRAGIREVLGFDALSLLKQRDFAIFLGCSFLLCIPANFYYVLANAYFNESGLRFPATKMALGQVSDLVFLSLLPLVLRRLGIKRVFVIGTAAWAVRYILLAYGNSGSLVWMFYGAILVHGICYSFFFVAAQIYVDSQAHERIRAAAQGLITLVNLGMGNYVGARLAGETLNYFTSTTKDGGTAARLANSVAHSCRGGSGGDDCHPARIPWRPRQPRCPPRWSRCDFREPAREPRTVGNHVISK